MEQIIKDIVDKGDHFEVQLENSDLSITNHKFRKGQGWEKKVTFDGMTKPRWLIHIEKIHSDRAESSKSAKIDNKMFKNLIGKRLKNGRLQD